MNTGSALIIGKVMHQRMRPVLHRFIYPVFFIRINLSAPEKLNSAVFGINRWRPLSLYFKDYGPRDGSDLYSWVRQLLEMHEINSGGTIFLQTFPRLFGYAFNPVSLWYCHNTQGQLNAILAEVNNTFGERHLYLLHAEGGATITNQTELISQKMMHVSPFCEVKGQYHFRFQEHDHSCKVKIDYADADEILIHTAISGQKQAFSTANLLKALLRQPLLTFGVMFRIHWQAFLLWRKHVPFFTAPAPPASSISPEPTSMTATLQSADKAIKNTRTSGNREEH